MNVAGIVVEYNPFHNGHLHHLQESRRIAQADYVVCVMSGHILQRGEPALFDKWSRASMAVASGADIVFELPYVYSGQSAETFATGAVALLQETGVVTHLCFGSETPRLDLLMNIAEVLTTEPPEYKTALKDCLDHGWPFPAAREKALMTFFYTQSNSQTRDQLPTIQELLARPNAILGIEYLKALCKLKSSIHPVAVERVGADYHDSTLRNQYIASATAIRTNLQRLWDCGSTHQEQLQALAVMKPYIPNESMTALTRQVCCGRGPVFADRFTPFIQYAIRTASDGQLKEIADIREGIENRISASSRIPASWSSLTEHIRSKRYPLTSLQRILFQILLGYTKTDATMVKKAGPQYLRVLAFSKQGRLLLKKMKETATLPIIHRTGRYKNDLIKSPLSLQRSASLRMLALDCLATDLYVMAFPDPDQRSAGQDYTTPMNSCFEQVQEEAL